MKKSIISYHSVDVDFTEDILLIAVFTCKKYGVAGRFTPQFYKVDYISHSQGGVTSKNNAR